MKRFSTLQELGELIPWSSQGVGVASMEEFEVSEEEYRAYFDLMTRGTAYASVRHNLPIRYRGVKLVVKDEEPER